MDVFEAISFFKSYALISDKELEVSKKEKELNIILPYPQKSVLPL